jgi:hypothetical protein
VLQVAVARLRRTGALFPDASNDNDPSSDEEGRLQASFWI